MGHGHAGAARPAGLEVPFDQHEIQRIEISGGHDQQ
jgi:hypothetical protein